MLIFNDEDCFVIDEYYKGYVTADPFIFDDLIVSIILKDYKIKKEVYKEFGDNTKYTVKIRESGFDIYISTADECFGVIKSKMSWSEESKHYVIKQDSYTKFITLNQIIKKDAGFIWKMHIILAFFILNADKVQLLKEGDTLYKSGETGLFYVTPNIYNYIVGIVGERNVGNTELDEEGKSDFQYVFEVT